MRPIKLISLVLLDAFSSIAVGELPWGVNIR